MSDLSQTIIPKSDQMNADDLIAGPLTIKVTGVKVMIGTEQPVAISFDGDGGKPYMPGKSMRRVLVRIWGADGDKYVGQSMTLYRDEKVQFGGLAVGGIRISHMTGIERDTMLALTATRGNKKAFTVHPLVVKKPADKPDPVTVWLDKLHAAMDAAGNDKEAVDAIMARPDVQKALDKLTNGARERLLQITGEAMTRSAPKTAEPSDDFPGDREDAA